MAINVIQGGNVASFDMLAFPTQNPANNYYIQNQLNNISTTLTDIGRQFIEKSREIYDRVNDSDTLRIARAAIRAAQNLFHPNEIIRLQGFDELRFAQPVMQRYIMAEPVIRQKYLKQQIDGFSDTYVNVDGKDVYEEQYDYRRVMSGVIQDTVDTEGNAGWVCKHYLDENRGDDIDLTPVQKSNILATWEIARMFIDAGEDPTDPFSKQK